MKGKQAKGLEEALARPCTPHGEVEEKAPAPDYERDAFKAMFSALTEISQANAFFDGEKRLKQIALRALREVSRLAQEKERQRDR